MTLFLGMILDALLGEPKWLWSRVPHPAALMGHAINWTDEALNAGAGRKAKGALTLVGLVAIALVLGLILRWIPGGVAEVLVLAVLLAQRSLSDHVLAVAKGLRVSLSEGRHAVAQIVGRDTTQMDEADAARAAIESAAENLSDGVIAPIFWFVLGGLPGLLIYKVTNTADSMIGYRTDRHAQFGWAAARFDDLLNWVPARITAGLILLVTLRIDVFERVVDDAPQHRSPNAGWPEAALAHALNFALSGPRVYDGVLQDDPFVNASGIRELNADHIHEVVWILWRVWGAVLALALAVGLFLIS